MTSLVRGANVVVARPDQDGLVIQLCWQASGAEFDPFALVVGANGKVLSEGHFVFFNNPETADSTVALRSADGALGFAGHTAQLQVHLTGLPNEAARIVVALATLEEGVMLDSLQVLHASAFDTRSGEVVATYDVGAERNGVACLVVVELYRHVGNWKLRAVGQGYASGLRGIIELHGVEVVDQ